MACGLTAILLRTGRAALAIDHPNRLLAASGIPLWPWMPGGIAWFHGTFHNIPFRVQTFPDGALPRGQNELVRPGSMGLQYQVGSERTLVFPPVPAQLAQGTAAVHQLVRDGVRYEYDRVLTAMTTAYNGSRAMNGRYGAVAAWNGKPLVFGDVAVDPRVIPLGSYLYVEGYGPARAVDTGSAIWGDHIDLFFPESSWRIALYGIQFHKVYVLVKRPEDWPPRMPTPPQ
jgi:3D (Asp-Asp-Asp) domain-containing protein